MKLIEIDDYAVLLFKYHDVSSRKITLEEYYEQVKNYADFLKMPLELWMFVPCAKIQNGWFELNEVPEIETDNEVYWMDFHEYNDALKSCLFDDDEQFEDEREFNYWKHLHKLTDVRSYVTRNKNITKRTDECYKLISIQEYNMTPVIELLIDDEPITNIILTDKPDCGVKGITFNRQKP